MAQAKQLEHANRMAAVGKLAAGLIHDIGTPLNVISGRAMMISAGGVSEDEIKHNARVVAEQASRIATMIRRLLTFARPKSGAAQADDVLAIAREHIELLSPLTRKTKVSIQITPESESIGVPATTAAVRQIFNNLLTNAIQAMPDGGVVTVGTGRERLAPPEGGEPLEAAFFYVADQGVGISSEQQDHLFEPFYSTQPEHEGSGLGLPVTEALARAFGGWIQVDSEAGKGARFTVVFPEANGQ